MLRQFKNVLADGDKMQLQSDLSSSQIFFFCFLVISEIFPVILFRICWYCCTLCRLHFACVTAASNELAATFV